MLKKSAIYTLILTFAVWLAAGVQPAPQAFAAETAVGQDALSLAKKLVVLPKGEYDRAEAQAMIGRIALIHPYILRGLIQEKVKIKLTGGPITNEPEMAKYKGVTPRGWEGTGLTWDDAPGSGGNPVILRIGYSDFGNGHGSVNLELHETAHVIDKYIFDDVSQSAAFKEIWKKEVKTIFQENEYYQYLEEYFAESLAIYYFADSISSHYKDEPVYVGQDGQFSRTQMKEKVPQTYAFFQKLEAGLAKKYGNEKYPVKPYVPPAKAIVVLLDGKPISFDGQQPLNLKGRVMVPVNGIFKALGAKVKYDAKTKVIEAELGGAAVKLTVGSKTAYLNGAAKQLDQEPIAYNGRIVLPVGFIAASFGIGAKWDGKTGTLTLTR